MNNLSVKKLINTERRTHVLFLAVRTMRRLIAGSALLMLILANLCSAQTVSMVANFRGSNATEYPLGMPTQGRDGNLYGTAYGTTYGSIFRVATGGTITQLYAFDGSNGINPFTGLTLANDGNFYGTTAFGNSAASAGMLFKVTPTGFFTSLYEFTPDSLSEFPEAAPIQASDNNFYGVAYLSVYKYVSSTKSFSTLNSFADANDVDGFTGALLQSSNGNLYGTGNTGGTSNCGGAFELARTGMLMANFSFDCQSPGTAGGPLVQANDGNYYGQTQLGGAFNLGAVFKMTPAGKVTNLHDFAGAANDGVGSILGLMQGTDGYLYGVTQQGESTGLALFSVFLLREPMRCCIAFQPQASNRRRCCSTQMASFTDLRQLAAPPDMVRFSVLIWA